MAAAVQVTDVTSLTVILSDFSIGSCSEQAPVSLGRSARAPGRGRAGGMLQVAYPVNQRRIDLQWAQASQKAHILP